MASNWFDLNTGKTSTVIPTSSNPVIFDGSTANLPITIGVLGVQTMTLQNGYNALITLGTKATLLDGGTFTEDNSSTLNVQFGDQAQFQIGGGGTINNMILAGFPTGAFMLQGGTTLIGNGTTFTDKIGVNFIVNTEATLKDSSWNPLVFTNNNLQIQVAGQMKVFYGTGTGATLIDSNGNTNDYIAAEALGTLTYFGSGGVADTFTVPVLVQDGTFALTSATGAPDGGKLTVQIPGNGQNTNTNNNSVYVTGVSYVQLSHAAALECDNNYYQSSGTLETMDTTTCTLIDGNGGGATATIAGGNVIIAANSRTSYGKLVVQAANLDFNGTLVVAIAGNTGNPGTSDLLSVTGTLTLQGNSSLYVNVNGQPVGGNAWIIIDSSNIVNNFTTTTSDPQTNVNYSPNNPEKGDYLISF